MPTDHSILLGLLGEHIAESMTPPMHEAEGRRHGIALVYRTLDPLRMDGERPGWGEMVRTAASFGYDGLNVTHPAKQAVIEVLDDLSDEARLLGAVNTIEFRSGRAVGENTDRIGFADALAAHDIDASVGEVVQIGAGGAGAAVAHALLDAGVPRLSLVDVDPDRPRALIQRLSAAFGASRMRAVSPEDAAATVRAASGLVNCTPIGMDGVSTDAPVDLAALHPGLWVGDAVYRPLRTTLVRAAQELGCPAFGGADMVVGQAVAAFEMFTGRPASRQAMYATFTAGSSILDHA